MRKYPTLKKNIGENIYRLRKQARFTQVDLSEKLGISQPHLSKIEAGLNYPDVPALWGCATLFGLPMEHFLKDPT